MPRLTRYFIKTALVYLAAALLLGLLLAARNSIDLPPERLALSPVYLHLFMVGWVAQLIFGMSFWMLPRFSREPRFGNQRLGWLAFALINCGVIAAGVGQWLNAPPAIIMLGRAAEVLAVVCFALHAWPRVRAIGV
jgi:cbb3-type cytochrome oxidase subunit 1